MRLAMRHTGPRPLALEFTSGQEFDVAIRDDRGERVYLWSADKLFTQALHAIEVSGERNWTAVVPLNALPRGSYTAEGFLSNAGSRGYSGTVGFSIVGPEPARP